MGITCEPFPIQIRLDTQTVGMHLLYTHIHILSLLGNRRGGNGEPNSQVVENDAANDRAHSSHHSHHPHPPSQ